MKNYLTILFVAISCYCVSCNSKSESGLSPAAQKNLDAMHGVSNSFDTKDFSKIGDYIAADAVDHSGENGDVKGLDSIKASFVRYTANVESQKTEVIKELADDEFAMSWIRYTGSFKKDQMGYKAGEKFDMKAIEIAKFKDGKAVEHWTYMDPGEVVTMMGKMQPPPVMPADSTKSAKPKK